jgi:hypothetical protein
MRSKSAGKTGGLFCFPARAFSSEVDTGWREENASTISAALVLSLLPSTAHWPSPWPATLPPRAAASGLVPASPGPTRAHVVAAPHAFVEADNYCRRCYCRRYVTPFRYFDFIGGVYCALSCDAMPTAL